MNTPEELTDELTTYPSGDDPNGGLNPLAGPVAARILALEARIEALEARPTPDAKVQVGAASIDTRAGLSVSDVVELSRALRGEIRREIA